MRGWYCKEAPDHEWQQKNCSAEAAMKGNCFGLKAKDSITEITGSR